MPAFLTWIGYSANEGKMLTLAILDEEFAHPGTEVTLIRGEPDGGTTKLTVEPHVQTLEIRGIVSPVALRRGRPQVPTRAWRLAGEGARLKVYVPPAQRTV